MSAPPRKTRAELHAELDRVLDALDQKTGTVASDYPTTTTEHTFARDPNVLHVTALVVSSKGPR